ncbi:hypothetical protein McpSp1_09150 [Methanocorpusculaceae archaeon Sp1]|nr:hypothetical protein [Methanocorpusculaceae archaeon Sp1]
MTTKATKHNACPSVTPIKTQGTGKEVLTGTPDKTIPVPSLQTLIDEGMKDLIRTLSRIDSTQDILTAKTAVTHALNTGWHVVSRLELIRAIEHRLPAPTRHQIDRCSLTKHLPTDTLLFGRVIGAFGDHVIFLTDNKKDESLPPAVRVLTIPADGSKQIPDWDTAQRLCRRTWKEPIIDAEYIEPVKAGKQQPVIVA